MAEDTVDDLALQLLRSYKLATDLKEDTTRHLLAMALLDLSDKTGAIEAVLIKYPD